MAVPMPLKRVASVDFLGGTMPELRADVLRMDVPAELKVETGLDMRVVGERYGEVDSGLYLPDRVSVLSTPPSLIQCSPIKMLNTVTRGGARGSKKRRLEDGSSSASVDGSSSPMTGDEAGDVQMETTTHNFPCVWQLDGVGLDGVEPLQISTPPPPPPPVDQTTTSPLVPPSPVPPAAEPLPVSLTAEQLLRMGLPASILNDHQPSPVMPPILAPSQGMGLPLEGEGEVCPECHKVFKRRVYLQRHMEREHWSTAKVFRCDDCAYETKHQSNLSVHRRTHTGERPYHCGACGQRYTQGHLLKSHIRSRHGADMQFYNLDKKSESSRGRKSLDPKHDSLPTINGGGTHKQDKISVLLQAASQQRFNLNHYMNALSPYLRPPLMTPSVALAAAAAGGLLMGGPRFYSLGGVPGALPAIGSAMLPPGVLPGVLNGALQPLKEVDAAASPPHPAPIPREYTPSRISEDEDVRCTPSAPPPPQPDVTSLPEDLSTKKVNSQPANHSPVRYNVSTMTEPCLDGASGCQHGRELKELRRNILKMLSVFTPELNIENGIDCDSDQVDQLLHEVVYSNDDDDDDSDTERAPLSVTEPSSALVGKD